MTVNKERMELLAAALESGDYRQVCGSTRIMTKQLRVIIGHCALGVAMDVALKNGLYTGSSLPMTTLEDFIFSHNFLPEVVSTWYGFDEEETDIPLKGTNDASTLNDNGVSFWDIAQKVRKTYLKDE